MRDLTRVPGEAPPLVFITGASSGIGQALAQRYAQAGWRLALGTEAWDGFVAASAPRTAPHRSPAWGMPLNLL